MTTGDEDVGATAKKVARCSYGKLVAFVAARSRDVAAAEDALADAFAAALRVWPTSGIPQNPEAWLLTVARRRQTDNARRQITRREAEQHLMLLVEELEPSRTGMDTHAIPDRRLGLMFACAHPAIEASARTPLILQTILVFDAKVIAGAFLVSPSAMSQGQNQARRHIRRNSRDRRIAEPARYRS